MYLTQASKEWLNNRNRPRLITNEIYQQNPASYEYNEDVDINNHSYRERNEVENYNDYNFDGRKSTLTSTAVNTCYPKNIKNLDNLITHSQDGATHRDAKVNWNETSSHDSKASSSKNKYAEKTTYCRPVFNVYHQDFIYKAIEKNAKLQLLLKKLVIARRKEKEEKERREYNNYVNKLKNRGHYVSYESRHMEPRYMESRRFESRHMDPQYIEPRYMKPRHIERQLNESCSRCYVEPNNQSLEFTNNPNSDVIYDPRVRDPVYEQELTRPRFNNHPQRKRVTMNPEFEKSHEDRPHLSMTSSFDRLLTLANEWQSSTRIPVNRPRSPSRIPVESENDRKYCCKGPLAIRKEEVSGETNPATATGGCCKRSLLANRNEESSRETFPGTTPGGICKACPCRLASMKEEESSRETYPAITMCDHCKARRLASMEEEESSRETYPATTTGSSCKACLLASRKEESSCETYPATSMGCHFKTSQVPGMKGEESSSETYPAITMCAHCKARRLSSMKEEESSRETYPATTTGGNCKACLLASRKQENSVETYLATSTGCHFKTSQGPGMKGEESSRETYPPITMCDHCEARRLPSMKEEESSRETSPATTTGGICKACRRANRKEESSGETYLATSTCGHFKTSQVPGMKGEESSSETYPATSTSVKIDVITQTSSLETTNLELVITDQVGTKEKYEEITQNLNRLKNQIDQDQEKQRRNTLSGLETKMELLADSIKSILSKLEAVREVSDTSTEPISGLNGNIAKCTSVSGNNVRVQKVENMPKATSTMCECDVSFGEPALPEKAQRPELAEKPDRPEHSIDTFNLQTEFVVRPLPTKYRHISSSTSKIDKIMCEELVKSNQFRKDIEEILCQSNSTCAVQISFDIPTRERCTEVTDSLSKAKLVEEQEISIEELTLSGDRNRQMTIAVNTDPMGLLAWFRMSSDTLKQLISYVPCVDYSRYLVRSPLPQLTTASVDYVCNICGACFSRPSLLNNHIQTHDLTNTRNCCICHHVLNIKPRSSARSAARFACRYCGQRFTRAYCCELHEQSCARAMGIRHDVKSGHGLLR